MYDFQYQDLSTYDMFYYERHQHVFLLRFYTYSQVCHLVTLEEIVKKIIGQQTDS